MGRWAQARHRGRGGVGAAPAGYAFDAPNDDNWQLGSAALNINFQSTDPGPDPGVVDGMRCRIRPDGSVTYTQTGDGDLNSGFSFPGVKVLGDLYDGQVCWLSAGVQVSDWSTEQTAVVSV